MDLSKYKGKKFKYDSPYGGLSNWTATIKSINISYDITLTEEAKEALKDFSKSQPMIGHKHTFEAKMAIGKERARLSSGYKLKISVLCGDTGHSYSLDRVVIID